MSDQRENTILYLQKILQRHETPEFPLTHAFEKMLGLTVCRHAVSLKTVIEPFLSKPISSKQSLLQTILLTATAEIFFMESPTYAIINSYVNLAKKHVGKSCGGFINAVLHKIANNKTSLLASYRQQMFPDSFLEILKQDYSDGIIKKIAQAAYGQPPLNLTTKNNINNWAVHLHAKKTNKYTLTVPANGKIEDLKGYAQGAWWVQDTAAALAVPQFGNLKGKRILDLCAAPGGKTAQLLSSGAVVTSLDSSSQRLDTLKQNLFRLNLAPENIICADALEYLKNFSQEPFDGILLDAPCSATGIFRRHPEIIHLKTVTDVQTQADLQKQILTKISNALKIGGELIYCTCSIAHKEGEEQISHFIKNNKNFEISPLNNPEEPQTITPQGFIRTLPFHYHDSGGCDAFFIAKLTKKSN
ncbi:MAG: methyltransferase domain-containing protein [Alphaproteobacteria bacterium]|nr:methyltransferase domain-containing protein [Alphaproteobacteria bacterium]